MALQVESESINHGERVPDSHAFGVPDGAGKAAPEGGNRSPHLRWSGAPEGTQSFALIVYDPDVPADFSDANQEDRTLPEDAPRRDFAHWLLVDISPDVTELPEGAGSEGIVAGGQPTGATDHGVTGANSYTEAMAGDPQMGGTYGGYDGPFPPFNDERLHHYHFVVHALDVPSLELEGDFTIDDVRAAMEGHVLDQGEIVGEYTLNAERL
jgi:Raf kinase inhibitor-like YbhB/YbcL family protein